MRVVEIRHPSGAAPRRRRANPALFGVPAAFASAAMTLSPLSPSGVGSFLDSAAAALALGGLASSASGSFLAPGTASIALGPTSPSATVTFTATASASPTLGPMGASATAFAGAFASAGIALGGASASASGTFATTASAGIALSPLAASAAGTSTGGTATTLTVAIDPFLCVVLSGDEIFGSAAYVAAQQAATATPTAADPAGEVLDFSFDALMGIG